MTDYRDLLKRYMDHVGQSEGVTFVMEIGKSYCLSKVEFTYDEITELNKINDEIENIQEALR
jgi:hypothetical protein